jgi:hypothetical protein
MQMKKFVMLLIFTLLLVLVGSVFAQNDTTTDVIVVPDIIVICPGQGVLQSVRIAAELVLEFNSVNGTWDVPFGTVSETDNGIIVEIGYLQLSCGSSAGDVTQIDRSDAVGLNEAAPQPENPTGLAESQAGHLIVVTGPANLRSCDYPTCSQVAIVRGGDVLVALGRNGSSGSNAWWFVQAGEIRGWIWSDLVAIRGDVSGIPIIETDGETTIARVYIGFTGNPIYDELSAAGQGICTVQGGLEYPLLGRNSDTSWVWIEAQCVDGTIVQGWMDARNVAIRNTGQVFVPIVGATGP